MSLLKVAEHRQYNYEIHDFIELMGYIIEAYNNRLPVADQSEKKILYAAAYNDIVMDDTSLNEDTLKTRPQNVVVYNIIRRENGTLGEDMFSAPREVRARRREETLITDADGIQKTRTIFGKVFDNIVRFECFSPSADQVQRLIMEVEGMLEVHAPWLESLGFHRVLYAGRTQPSFAIKTQYHGAAFQVYVKSERLWYRDDAAIRDIQLEVEDLFQARLAVSPDLPR